MVTLLSGSLAWGELCACSEALVLARDGVLFGHEVASFELLNHCVYF